MYYAIYDYDPCLQSSSMDMRTTKAAHTQFDQGPSMSALLQNCCLLYM